jgi:hypothetical protein
MKRKKKKLIHSALLTEDGIGDLESLTLRMESGALITIHPLKELHIPSDPVKLRKAADMAPARLLLFRHQAVRVGHEYRQSEHALERLVGEMRLRIRSKLTAQNHPEFDPDQFGVVDAFVDSSKEVVALKAKLRLREYLHEKLKALCGALEHRLYIIRKHLSVENDPRE